MSEGKKLIFLDRDGVINKDPGGWTEYNYVTKQEDFHFLPGSKEAVKKLNDAGYEIIMISNQAGISKKYFSEADLKKVTFRMLDGLREAGGKVKKVFYCMHDDSDNCNCRKPKTGLFEQAEKELRVKARGNYFVGDGKMDVGAAAGYGLKSILLLSGKSKLGDVRNWEFKPDYIFQDLAEAVRFILKGEKA